jgi:hypothetical protein
VDGGGAFYRSRAAMVIRLCGQDTLSWQQIVTARGTGAPTCTIGLASKAGGIFRENVLILTNLAFDISYVLIRLVQHVTLIRVWMSDLR